MLYSVAQDHPVREALVAPTLNGQKVLLVEDEFLLADEIKKAVLQLDGTPLGPVPSVGQALALLEHHRPDFAILNIRLGSEFSFPVADELLRRGCPYVFASASPQIDIPERHRAVPLWSKPINIVELVSSLTDRNSAAQPIDHAIGFAKAGC
jgi:CheY-like chemotaxis protein